MPRHLMQDLCRWQRITFLKDHLSVPPAEARVIVKRFASLDRSMVIHMHAPVAIYNKDYLLLL